MMSSDEEGQVRTGSGPKRRKLQRACDVCRRKKIRCDGVQIPGHQCTNCTDYGLECTYVESAKKRGPPKLYIERLENRVKKLQELIGKISPEALEQLDNSPTVSLQISARNPPIPQWSPYDPTPRRFIRHLGSGNSPVPVSDDDEPASFLMDDFDRMHISLGDFRYLGKSSGIMLIKLALEMKRVYMGDGVAVPREQDVKQPYINPLPVTPMQTPIFKFPDPDLIATLIDLYFKNMNRYLPLLHRPTFERAVDSGLQYSNTSFAATLLLVCAVAAKYSDDPRVMDEPKEPGGTLDPLSSGWKWFRQVPLVKTAPLSLPNLYDLQFYALIGEFLQASSVPQACWTVVGIGIRIAQDVGAHRRKPGKIHTTESELWNRAFWVLVCMDRLFSSSLGRPCSIQDEDFDIDMPVECDDEYWEHPDPKLRWQQPTPEKTPSVMVYFSWYIKLNHILAFLLRTVYAINKSRILYGFVGQQWEEHIVSELDSALNSWMLKLPDHLRWDPTRLDEVFFNQSASLYCFYQHIQILVHRPFIPTPQKPNKALSFPSLAICTNAARACSTALDIQRRRFGLAPPPLTTAAFSAGVVLLLSIWGGRRSGLPMDFDKEMVDVKKCMDVLALAEVRWYLAGRLSDILHELTSVGDMPLPQRESHSPPAILKRERKKDADDDDDEYVPKSAARSGRRVNKQADSMPMKDPIGVQRAQTPPSQSLFQSYNLPGYDFDFHQSQQQKQFPQQPSLNPQQYWPRQTTSQLSQKQYDTYVQPRLDASSQDQPPVSVPALGQNFRPAIYGSEPGAMSSFIPSRAVEMGHGIRSAYSHRTGGEAADAVDTVGVDLGLRQRTEDTGLGSDSAGGLIQNVDQTFIWSDAPASFELDEWGNYLSALNTQSVPPGRGPYNSAG
ncbi:Activator of stress genes 1 [Termitomyces sp. T112]|nr:Activator of stress genes 1 [Termitomyces sp. T112]